MIKRLVLAGMMALPLAAPAVADEEVVLEALQDYADFATYEQGIILPEQIDQMVFEAALFIDSRDAEQFEAAHIPGAINIEWRELPYRLDEIPESGMVITPLACSSANTFPPSPTSTSTKFANEGT